MLLRALFNQYGTIPNQSGKERPPKPTDQIGKVLVRDEETKRSKVTVNELQSSLECWCIGSLSDVHSTKMVLVEI